MVIKKIFLASSAELKADRDAFEVAVCRKNKEWIKRGVFLEVVMWEDFLDVMSRTRLQDEYNRAVRECDLFVMLFWTKVGKYTTEEFEAAFKQFQATQKPFLLIYLKDAPIQTGSIDEDDLMSLLAFKKKLNSLGHFPTHYENKDRLENHFNRQLEKLAANGFVEFKRDPSPVPTRARASLKANNAGSGAAAAGNDSTAVGKRGVIIRGDNHGDINTGTQVNLGSKPRRETD